MPVQDNRPAVYPEGAAIIYRASALGHCIRMLWAARSGLEARPIPKPIKKAMDEGTELEDTILKLLYDEHNFTYGYQGQQFQMELNLGAWNGITLIVRGRCDEIGYNTKVANNPLPIDVKAFRQELVDEYRTKGLLGIPRYAWQQSVYGVSYGSDAFYMPIYNKDTQKIEPWSLEPLQAPYTRDQIRDRVIQVEEWYDKSLMPDDCPAEFGCQYYYLHEQKDEGTIPPAVEQMLRARIKLSAKIDTLTNAKKTLDDAIKPKLDGKQSYHFEGYTVSIVPNSRRFNTKAAQSLLTAAEVDWQNDEDFWTPGEGTYLRVTKPKGKGGDESR